MTQQTDDDKYTVRHIDWGQVFPATMIFRSFRVAIHPSKLALALLMLFALWSGGRVLDALWPAEDRAVPGEVGLFIQARETDDPTQNFRIAHDAARAVVEADFKSKLVVIGKPGGSLADIKYQILQARQQRVEAANNDLDSALRASGITADQAKTARADHAERVGEAYRQAADQWTDAKNIEGIGLFRTIANFEMFSAFQGLHGVLSANFLGADGVVESAFNAVCLGPAWALRVHWVYFGLYGIYFLVAWSIFGGAITRIAAVQIAQKNEKISIRQALAFSVGKFLSFFSAPLIPMVLAGAAGLALAIGGAVANLPFLGPIAVGAGFFLALILGFVITLILLGAIGGFNLMYPTIAVEGSDSFDAISRGYSYAYARPWRLAFYTLVALIYGAITFLFVRFFVLLMLSITHACVGLFIFTHADDAAPLWGAMWPSLGPGQRLAYDINYLTLGVASGQGIGATFLALWVYLIVGLLGAFAISMHFSAQTIIYYLMRLEVESTELDDVYLEQPDDEPDDAGGAETVAVTTTVAVIETGPGEEAGPGTPPSSA